MTTSYFDKPLSFKLRKVFRYVSLYGASRTLVKVRAQAHMRRDESIEGTQWKNRACRRADDPQRSVAIIGCGNFSYSAIAYYLYRHSRHFLRATLDSVSSRAISLCRDYGGAYATTDIAEILTDPQIRLVYIASNHASHADYAVQCIEAGKHVHIEKPHVVSDTQLQQLLDAKNRHPSIHVYLGFNRPRSRHFRHIVEALQAQSGLTMVNWFIAGHEIPDDHWYFKEEEGGRVLGNLCHWTDLTLELIGLENAFPCEVVPVLHNGSKSDFCVGLKFADRSVAGITFSAKGHTFEGVRELLQAHRGNALIRLRDFEESIVEIVEKRSRIKTFYRDHGHKLNILNSFDGAHLDQSSQAVDPRYLEATAKLFLGIREAFDEQVNVTVDLDRH